MAGKKKGRYLNSRGYFEVKVENHPFANNKGYVREHRLVMEDYLKQNDPDNEALITVNGKKYLSPEYEPHHKNHDKKDNRIENLDNYKHDEHARYHIKLREEVKKETMGMRKKILSDLIKATILEEYKK